jgi:hypothetical protein
VEGGAPRTASEGDSPEPETVGSGPDGAFPAHPCAYDAGLRCAPTTPASGVCLRPGLRRAPLGRWNLGACFPGAGNAGRLEIRRGLPGGGAEPGSEVLPGAARAAFDVLPIVAEGDVQPEPAGARGPQLLPVALRHPGHPDLRTLVPPGPAPACSGTEITVVRSSTDGSRELSGLRRGSRSGSS